MWTAFPAQTQSYRGRKRAFRACERCKKLRRKCQPTATGTCERCLEFSETCRWQDNLAPDENEGVSVKTPSSEVPKTADEGDGLKVSRFVGDLNPEATFLGRGEEHDVARSSRASQDRNDIGLWVDPRKETHSVHGRHLRSINDLRQSVSSCLGQLQATVASLRLPDGRAGEALEAIYFRSINPLLQIVDERGYMKSKLESACPILLSMAILMVAARHSHAATYLAGESCRDFAKRLHDALSIALKSEAEKDKLVRIQVLALMSIHSEGPEGNEVASSHLLVAIHHAQILALHLDRVEVRSNDMTLKRLFWGLFCLDRLKGSINGGPVMIRQDDCPIRPEFSNDQTPDADFGAFRIWLRLADMMDKVISFYRPSANPATTGWEEDFPDFVEVVASDGERVLDSTLEIYYHAIAILSCRFRGDMSSQPLSTPSRVRQALSALQIPRLVNATYTDALPPLQVIPYALTLSMAVAYRQFRQARLENHRQAARRDWESSWSTLAGLSYKWWMAESFSRLGKKAMDKVVAISTDASRSGQKRKRRDMGAPEATETRETASSDIVADSQEQVPDFDAGSTLQLADSWQLFGNDDSLFGSLDDLLGSFPYPDSSRTLQELEFANDWMRF